jgi:Holliday junction resolvasome RuvABC endonuclease subunit
VGTRFQQGDETIVVLGKLRNVIRPAVQKEEAEPEAQQVIAAPVGTGDSEKRTVSVAVEKTKAPGDARRRRMVRTVAPTTNEPKPEGKGEGAS